MLSSMCAVLGGAPSGLFSSVFDDYDVIGKGTAYGHQLTQLNYGMGSAMSLA